ncbi:MAG TPA: gluconate 2-dehydrogenase subunit 3 family protein, partial [Gemmatimonadaceae bacterium]|nr:gluconate 2-dehydrogenase subunit 3 family protein [Gemmatimonadaceae bacterium]
MTDPTTGSIDRRAALRRVALLLGGALSAPAIAGVLAGCEGHDRTAAGFTPRALTPAQAELMAVVAEHIIPTTDTPGAREVGAPAFIDL